MWWNQNKSKQKNAATTQGRLTDQAFCCYLKSLLLASSLGEIDQGRLWGRHSRASGEKSEKSTPYSVRIPSVSGSISPAWPRLLASCLQKEGKGCFFKCVITTLALLPSLKRGCRALKRAPSPIRFSLCFGRGLGRNSDHTMTYVCWRCKTRARQDPGLFCIFHFKEMFYITRFSQS